MKPGLLVASPQMIDPFFGRAVILLCEYNAEGAMGLVVNRPLGIALDSVLEQLNIPRASPRTEPVLWGGPVMPETGFLLVRGRAEAPPETIMKVTPDIYVSSSRLLLEEAASGELKKPYMLCLGYAGWGPGQLDEEIKRGTWLVFDLDEEVIFHTELEQRWEKCIQTLGVDAELIWMAKPVDE